jgi:large conductance mechanosensitive channel
VEVDIENPEVEKYPEGSGEEDGPGRLACPSDHICPLRWQPAILLDPSTPTESPGRRRSPDRYTCGRVMHGRGTEEIGMGMLKEFREFAVKGNVIDLAVGIIIGAAFGKIVDSLVRDVVMPVVNAMLGGAVDFTNKYWVLSGTVPAGAPLDVAQKSAVVFAWGNFITVLLNFVILAFVIFWMVKSVNRMKSRFDSAPAAPAATPEDVVLLREIRDELRRK